MNIKAINLKNKANYIKNKKVNLKMKEDNNDNKNSDNLTITGVVAENLKALELGARDIAIKNPGFAFSQIAQELKPEILSQIADKIVVKTASNLFLPLGRGIQLVLDFYSSLDLNKTNFSKLDKNISKGRVLTDIAGFIGAIGAVASIPGLTAISPLLLSIGLVGDIASTSYFATQTLKTTSRQIINNFKKTKNSSGN